MNTRIFHFIWNSPGNTACGDVFVKAIDLPQAQDLFFNWLRDQPIYSHMWCLNVEAVEAKLPVVLG